MSLVSDLLGNLNKKISGSGFIKNSLVSGFGIAGGQVIALLSTPVLARIYGPAEFGVFATFTSLSGVIATITAFRLDVAIPASDENEASTLAILGLLMPIVSFFILCLLIYSGLYRYLNWPKLLLGHSVAIMVAVAACLQGLLYVIFAQSVRSGNFNVNALLRIAQPLFFFFAAYFFVSYGLVVAFCFGLVGVVVLGLLKLKMLRPRKDGLGFFPVLRKYWEYPVISMPVSLLDSLTLALPVLVISSYYGAESTGNYSQVIRLSAAPISLIVASISQVFYKYSADVYRDSGRLYPVFIRTVRRLCFFSILIFCSAALLGSMAFRLVLGSGWRTDTLFILLSLSPALIRMCVSPVTSLLLVCRKVRIGAIWQIIYFSVSSIVLLTAASHLTLECFFTVLIVNECAMYGLYFMIVKRVVDRHDLALD